MSLPPPGWETNVVDLNNFTPATAFEITGNYNATIDFHTVPTGHGLTSSCGAPPSQVVFFTFTPNVDMIGAVYFQNDLHGNGPFNLATALFTGPPSSPTPYNDFCSGNLGSGAVYFQFSATAGQTYYLQVGGLLGLPESNGLVFIGILVPPRISAPAGAILIPSDTAGFPVRVFSSITGDVLQARFGLATEFGDAVNTGELAFGNNFFVGSDFSAQKTVNIFTRDYVPIATINAPGIVHGIKSDRTSIFYYTYIDDSNNWHMSSVSKAGIPGGVTWDLPNSAFGTFAVARDGSTVYYGNGGVAGDPVHAFDLINNLPLADLNAGQAGFKLAGKADGFVLGDGTICVGYATTSLVVASKIIRYNPNGSVNQVYPLPLSVLLPSFGLNHFAIDPDDLSFWVWSYISPNSVFRHYRLSDGVDIGGVFGENANQNSDGPWPTSPTCPLVILTRSMAPPDNPFEECVPVTITSDPSNVTIEAGETTTLFVEVEGTEPFTYQWYLGTSGNTSHPIPAAIEASYTTQVLEFSTQYWVQVENECGSADSATATVTVTPVPPPVVGPSQTLLLDIKGKRWFADVYPSPCTARLWEPGEGVHTQELGHADGTVDLFSGHDDQGQAIPYVFQVPDIDGGDPRRDKLFGDAFLSVDPKAVDDSFVVTPGFDDFETVLTPQTVTPGTTVRTPIVIDINFGEGQLARNMGIRVEGASDNDPAFFLWEPSLVPKVELTYLRATDWEEAGQGGSKFFNGIILECDTNGQDKTILVQFDGGQLGATLTINHAGQQQQGYSFDDPGPFIGHLVRLFSADNVPWHFYRLIWRYETSPESTVTWETQDTTLDGVGYGQIERILPAYISTQDATLSVIGEGLTLTYALPNSNGAYVKPNIILAPNKSKFYRFRIVTVTGEAGIRVFQRDLEVRFKSWGSTDPYRSMKPFGDNSRDYGGARI